MNNDNSFLLRIVTRFLFRSRSVGALPWLSLFALVSVAVGVATLILVLSIMNGFSSTLQQQLVGVYSSIRVYPTQSQHIEHGRIADQLKDDPDVTMAVGVIEGEVLLKSSAGQYRGGRVMAFSRWRKNRLPVANPPDEGVYLGQGLAGELLVFPGDEVSLIRTERGETPFGPIPDGMTLPVENTVRSGYQPVDRYLSIVSWSKAHSLFDVPEGRADYVELWHENRFQSNTIKRRLREQLPDRYSFRTWQEANPALFQALELEREVTFIVLALIILVASINILSMLILSIMQRRQQIAMMMAMGASPRTVLGLFLGAGLLITVAGLGIGFGLGLGGAYLLNNVFVISLPPVYPMSHLPVDVEWLHLVWIGLVTLGLGFLSSFYPAWSASKIDPAEVLRYG